MSSNGYVIFDSGKVLIQTISPSAPFGFELCEPPAGEWEEIGTVWSEWWGHVSALGQWTLIADDDPRIPYKGYSRQWADWHLACFRAGRSLPKPWEVRARERERAKKEAERSAHQKLLGEVALASNAYLDVWEQYIRLQKEVAGRHSEDLNRLSRELHIREDAWKRACERAQVEFPRNTIPQRQEIAA